MEADTGSATAARTGILLVAVSAASFGALAVFARIAYDGGADVTTLLALRFALASAVLLVLVRLRGLALPRGRTLLALAALGGVGYVGQSLTYFSALTFAPAGLVALLLYLYPGFVTLLAVATGRDRWTRGRVLALALATVGTALTVGADGGGGGDDVAVGVALAVASAVIYAGYIVLSEGPTGRAGALPSSAVITAAAAVVLGVTAVAADPEPPTSAAGWSAVVAVALVSTVLAITTFFAGLARLGPSTAATLSTLEPVVTVALAALVLSESFAPLQALGGAVILVAVLVLIRSG